MRASSEFDLQADMAIVGGGMAGMTLACALTLTQAGVSVVVIDREAPERALSTGFDGRVSAIALGSAQMLRSLGLWPALEAAAQPILDIRITDGESPFILHYDHAALGSGPLGYIIENRAIRGALSAAAGDRAGLTVLAPCSVVSVETDAGRATVTLGDGRVIGARLAVGADGRASPVRVAAGIGSFAWTYPQVGIVCTVHHAVPHGGVAHERFLPAGPFAMLPMTGNRCSLVWTERRGLADRLMALDDAAFQAEVAWRFGDHLGPIEVVGPRWCYPLSVTLARSYVGRRLAIVGDAAHTIHPIAGQGFNLGLRDIAALAEAVVDARRLGLDIGTDGVLTRYERWRRFDSMVMLGVTDGLNRLFSNDIPPIRLARDLGLAVVDRVPALKRAFMRHAMGLAGDPPRLIRGESL